MAKFNITLVVNNFCNDNRGNYPCLSPDVEAHDYEVEAITRVLSLQYNTPLKHNTIERRIRAWKRTKRNNA